VRSIRATSKSTLSFVGTPHAVWRPIHYSRQQTTTLASRSPALSTNSTHQAEPFAISLPVLVRSLALAATRRVVASDIQEYPAICAGLLANAPRPRRGPRRSLSEQAPVTASIVWLTASRPY